MIKEWAFPSDKGTRLNPIIFLEKMSLYPFVDEPFAELRRMLDEALHTVDHGVRRSVTQYVAQHAQVANQQGQRQGGEERNPDGVQPR